MTHKEKTAYWFAEEAHRGQVDDEGLPYFASHILPVVAILQIITKDIEIIQAGYLHDIIEDTEYTYEDIKNRFGKRVADLVNEVTHEGKKDEVGYYFPRLKTKDGIILKFADRLSNLSRMNSWDEKRQQQYLKKSKFWKSKNENK